MTKRKNENHSEESNNKKRKTGKKKSNFVTFSILNCFKAYYQCHLEKKLITYDSVTLYMENMNYSSDINGSKLKGKFHHLQTKAKLETIGFSIHEILKNLATSISSKNDYDNIIKKMNESNFLKADLNRNSPPLVYRELSTFYGQSSRPNNRIDEVIEEDSSVNSEDYDVTYPLEEEKWTILDSHSILSLFEKLYNCHEQYGDNSYELCQAWAKSISPDLDFHMIIGGLIKLFSPYQTYRKLPSTTEQGKFITLKLTVFSMIEELAKYVIKNLDESPHKYQEICALMRVNYLDIPLHRIVDKGVIYNNLLVVYKEITDNKFTLQQEKSAPSLISENKASFFKKKEPLLIAYMEKWEDKYDQSSCSSEEDQDLEEKEPSI